MAKVVFSLKVTKDYPEHTDKDLRNVFVNDQNVQADYEDYIDIGGTEEEVLTRMMQFDLDELAITIDELVDGASIEVKDVQFLD